MAYDLLVTEGFSDCGAWAVEGDHDIITWPGLAAWFSCASNQLRIQGGTLGLWLDGAFVGNPAGDGPFVRSCWWRRTFTGIPPNTLVGVHLMEGWILQGDSGTQFMQVDGIDSTRVSIPNGGFNLWSIPAGLADLKVREEIAYVRSTLAGTVTVKWGVEGVHPSTNQHAVATQLEIVQFKPSAVGGYVMSPKDVVAP